MPGAIYQRYRPITFQELIGQEHVKQTLQGAITKQRVGHAYLFCGPRGTGKTTSARLLATIVNCTNIQNAEPCNICDSCKTILEKRTLDIIEIDAASHTGVDNIRELRENIKIPPQQLTKKVYIIDEVHMLSGGAFNALLKTLEEPPNHALFILATTEAHKIPATILSRVQRLDFNTVPAKLLLERLRTISKKEKITIEDDALRTIIQHTKGHVRDAESLLSQILALDSKKIVSSDITELLGLTPEHAIQNLLQKTISHDAKGIIEELQQLLENGSDIEFLHKELIEYARLVLLLTVDPSLEKVAMPLLTNEQRAQLQKIATSTTKKQITSILTTLLRMREYSRYSPIPELPLQLALLEAADTAENKGEMKKTKTQNPPQTSANAVNIIPRKTIIIKKEGGEKNSKPKEESSQNDYIQNLRPVAKNIKTTIEHVHENWNTVIDELKTINHPLGTCLQSSSPIKMEIDTILLATTFPFHKERIDELTNKQLIGRVLDKIFKERLNVRAVLKDSIQTEQHQQLAPKAPIDNNQQGVKKESKEEKQQAPVDDLAKAALEIFGGELVG